MWLSWLPCSVGRPKSWRASRLQGEAGTAQAADRPYQGHSPIAPLIPACVSQLTTTSILFLWDCSLASRNCDWTIPLPSRRLAFFLAPSESSSAPFALAEQETRWTPSRLFLREELPPSGWSHFLPQQNSADLNKGCAPPCHRISSSFPHLCVTLDPLTTITTDSQKPNRVQSTQSL